MRVVGVYNSSDKTGTVSEYCYKLGLEAGGTGTVLGYTAMEGLQVHYIAYYVFVPIRGRSFGVKVLVKVTMCYMGGRQVRTTSYRTLFYFNLN